jgi:general secretion pathway protein C
VTGARPGTGVAILRSQGRARVVAVGESAFGARVVSVAPDRIVIERDGRTEELRLTSAAPLPAAPRAQAPEAAPRLLPSVVAAPGEPVAMQRSLSREDVQRRLSAEIPRILGETALRPVSEDGRVVGLQIVKVASGTLLTELGLRSGDVLTQINGTPTDSLPALMALWGRLQGESALRASVLRDGRSVQLSVDIR